MSITFSLYFKQAYNIVNCDLFAIQFQFDEKHLNPSPLSAAPPASASVASGYESREPHTNKTESFTAFVFSLTELNMETRLIREAAK